MKLKSITLLLFTLLSVRAVDIRFTWSPNTESNLEGYRMYSSVDNGAHWKSNNVGNVTTYTVTGLEGLPMAIFQFYVTAINSNKLESLPSNIVKWTNFPMAVSVNVTGYSISNRVGTNWLGVAVTFTPIDLSLSGATGYSVRAVPATGATVTVNVTSSPATFAVLPIKDYTFSVVVVGTAGTNSPGNTVVLSGQPPSPVQGVKVEVGP